MQKEIDNLKTTNEKKPVLMEHVTHWKYVIGNSIDDIYLVPFSDGGKRTQ